MRSDSLMMCAVITNMLFLVNSFAMVTLKSHFFNKVLSFDLDFKLQTYPLTWCVVTQVAK